LHRDAGVALRVGVGVERVVPSPDGTSATVVHLSDGTALPADVVVVGIGVVPVVDWLGDSGVGLDNGVVCNDRLFAADNVVAAGDVARWTHVGLGEDIRIEHWTNAAEGGAVAARNLVVGSAAAESYAPVPFFWSDQYGAKIQVIGRPRPDDEVVVVDGTAEDRKLVALYRRGDRLSAALAISRPRQLMAYRPLLDAGASFDDALGLSRA
jgi:NADPH-dependent 2,4-dienoyl-CoA reductase/sulfur reductase-like enzyme